ncbi:MAG: RluA family pseudouridine synthase [Clostridia bacterium]|nr:RluA family pseudouridine synthase [Clostridia bacterium]
MEIIIINANDAGQRLDSFLKKIMPCTSAGLIYKYIRTNKIKLNSKKPKPDTRLCEGDEIKYFGDSSLLQNKKFEPVKYSLDVVYEDENILAVNKPAGLPCQSDARHQRDTLADYVKSYLFEKGEYDPNGEMSFSPALCNRLDFNTAGMCIAAKNAESLRILNAKIKSREVRRFYMCVTEGVPPEKSGIVKTQLQKDGGTNVSHIVTNGGKSAETHYMVLKENGKNALVELEIISGRSHQIRVHMAHLGCPVSGDPKYGFGGKGQKLISHKAIFAFKTDAGRLNYLKDKEIKTESRLSI